MNRHFFSFILMTALFAAVFTSCEKDNVVPTFIVTFDSKGGSQVMAQTVKEGGLVIKPTDPILENYSFGGWSKADNEISLLWNFEVETVTADMMLFARWAIKTYSVTFDSDGGSTVFSQEVAHGSTATKPVNPTRNGYYFDGWYNDDTEWNFATSITAPITLKAKWTKEYTVIFDSKGGSQVESQTVKEGNAIEKPVDPIRENYSFGGWAMEDNDSGVLWNFETEVVFGDMTLYALWSINTYTVTFDSDGGSSVPVQTIAHGETATQPSDPIKSGYEFDGWFNGDVKWDFATAIIAPVMLKAKWSIVPERGVLINGITWATRNVDAPGTFTVKSEDAGMFYQFNRKVGWSAIEPRINSNGDTTWDSSTPSNVPWEKTNDPCPVGWHPPYGAEIQTLLDADRVSNVWTSVNGVSGRKFTDRDSGNSIFLPAAGFRSNRMNGELDWIEWAGEQGFYWSSTLFTWYVGGTATNWYGVYWRFDSNLAELSVDGSLGDGNSVRCVAD